MGCVVSPLRGWDGCANLGHHVFLGGKNQQVPPLRELRCATVEMTFLGEPEENRSKHEKGDLWLEIASLQ